MKLSKIESKKILQNALRGLARKERISKHNASAVRNSQKFLGK